MSSSEQSPGTSPNPSSSLSDALEPGEVCSVVLSVMNLKYSHVQSWFMRTFQPDESALLENVTFSAKSGELLGILAPRDAERRTLMELISNRRRYGEFDGEVLMTQTSSNMTSPSMESGGSRASKSELGDVSATDSMAFVPRDAVSLYLPGLTYKETLLYAAHLRMPNASKEERGARVDEMLEVMNLTWCKDRVIADRPTARGKLGGELRKMAVAVEIITLPPVLVLADITQGLDATISSDIVYTMAMLASRGHTVIASFDKIYPEEVKHFQNVTLISRGYSIYSSSPENIVSYFSSIDYECANDADVGQFLLDVGRGTERPVGERRAPEANDLQAKFEESNFYDQYRTESSVNVSSPVLHRYKGGFSSNDSLSLSGGNFWIVMERAWRCKFKEVKVLKKSIGASVGLALFFGYFAWQLGAGIDYLTAFIPFPYSETSTTTSVMYLSTSIQVGMQVLNVHIIFQKQKVFRYERSTGVVSLPSFVLASLISEIVLASFFSLIFSTIVYFMVGLGVGIDAYLWWISLMQMTSTIGVLIVLMFTSIFQNELYVRDFFLYCLTTMIWTGGFLYPQSFLTDWVVMVININPLRWLFQSVMVWKWSDYPDADVYLNAYEYGDYHQDDIWIISVYFIVTAVSLYIVGLMRFPSSLRRAGSALDMTASRDSQLEADLYYSKKLDSLQKPNIISRESSFSNVQRLSSQASTAHGEEIARGPRVTFVNLAYQVPDLQSPVGKKSIIHPMSGLFDWGKLGVIMGAEGSGKSSLLHILGNQTLGSNAELKGTIFHDDKNVDDVPLLPWQRCAFIEALDEHFRDLTVLDILTYAMLLRTDEALPEKELESNVNIALEMLQLETMKDTKAKKLSEGERRRLSIAEDIVHGPHLILMDEPITGLDPRESSIIMTHTIRELVNQDRTVIVTLYQPSASVFDVCDTLALLSRGRLIYMGNAADAVNYFIESPALSLKLESGFENPADFLLDLSANTLRDSKNGIIDATRLEQNYMSSSLYMIFHETHLKNIFRTSSTSSVTENPINRLSVSRSAEDAHEQIADVNETVNEWRFATTVDVSRSRSRSMSIAKPLSSKSKGVVSRAAQNRFRRLLIPFLTSIEEIKAMNVRAQCRKAYVLNRRAFYALYKREKLVIGTTLMYAYIAVFTCLIIRKNQENNPSVTTAVGMFGAFLLLVSQLQFVFFLFNNQKVFLKEHSRGLYSAFLRWLVEDKPLMLLRFFQGLMYGIIVHEWIGYQGGDRGLFFYAMTVLITLGFTMLVETVVYTLPDLRTAYGSVLSVALFLFIFSGLIFKPDILPWYLSPWLPSVSMIRWFAQGIIINEFEDNSDAFPPIPFLGGESAYPLYLSMFGWGGKTKWFCMNCVIINIVIFKFLSLLVSWKAVINDKGSRCMRRKEIEDRIY